MLPWLQSSLFSHGSHCTGVVMAVVGVAYVAAAAVVRVAMAVVHVVHVAVARLKKILFSIVSIPPPKRE